MDLKSIIFGCAGSSPARSTIKLDLYIEVKGYETDRDRAKWKYFPKKLRVIRSKDIKEIRKGCFGGL
jgi:hypothetical protein